MEYTYFFARNDFWHEIDFYTTFGVQQPYEFIIPDSLLVDKLIKEHGYPLKGRGYAVGIKCRNEKIYMDFLMTSMYFAHIAVQCDDSGKYVSGGDIIFPLSWDTEEKRNSAVLKGFRFHRDKPCKQCKLSGDKENVDIGYSTNISFRGVRYYLCFAGLAGGKEIIKYAGLNVKKVKITA